MLDYDNLPAEIDRLHAEAEDLRDVAAKFPEGSGVRRQMLSDASAKVARAAKIRAQIDDEDA